MKAIAYIAAVLALGGVGCSNDDDDDQGVPPPGSTTTRAVTQTDIVSDENDALVTDPQLVNAWGLAFNPVGAAWVSATETGVSTVYDGQGNALIPAVTIPDEEGEPGSPTGQVFNADEDAFEGNVFIFVTEDGTIAGWEPAFGDVAELHVDNSRDDANYKGVTIVLNEDEEPFLFAADFFNGKVDVFDSDFEPVDTNGGFTDPDLPRGFAPFNVEELGGNVVVTYALQDEDKEDDVKGKGNGYVNLFDIEGNFLARLVSEDELNSPWGVTLAPSTFSAAPNRLLIGNFGGGLINVYALDMEEFTADFEGTLQDSSGDEIRIDGLWALKFGVNAGGFSASTLYFTAGPDDEEHGVFGRLTSVTRSGGGGSSGSTGGGIY